MAGAIIEYPLFVTCSFMVSDNKTDVYGQEACRACKRKQSIVGKLGIEDVEEWIKSTDKNGVRVTYQPVNESDHLFCRTERSVSRNSNSRLLEPT